MVEVGYAKGILFSLIISSLPLYFSHLDIIYSYNYKSFYISIEVLQCSNEIINLIHYAGAAFVVKTNFGRIYIKFG